MLKKAEIFYGVQYNDRTSNTYKCSNLSLDKNNRSNVIFLRLYNINLITTFATWTDLNELWKEMKTIWVDQ